MGMKIFDGTNSGAFIRNDLERTNRAALKAMREGAEKVVDLARKQAPIDEGNLEEAITSEESRTGINGRTVIAVGVNEDVEVMHRPGKTVGDYATEMHEGLYPGSKYDLGPRSQDKQRANPDIMVGGKFLERAVDELAPEIEAAVKRAVEGIL
jgi:hypothetical protein